MQKGILIKNGTIITLGEDCRVLNNHSLLIVDDKIEKIAPSAEFTQSYQREIDATGQVVLPGFINAHMHFYSTLVRGLGKAEPAADFDGVLRNLWWRLDKKLSLEDTYYSALTMLIQGLRQGTTTYIDHQASPGHIPGCLDEIARAVRQTGVQASLCYELSDRDGQDITRQGLEENVRFIKACQNSGKSDLQALFGLHASFTISDETLEQAAGLAHAHNTGFHVHLAEAESDQQHCIKQHGCRVAERFYRHGILGPRTIAAHCVQVDQKERELLAATHTGVVHNPQSNLNNAVGIADVIALQKQGVLVGLGTDAMTVNMLEELRVAMWAQHLGQNNPGVGFMEITDTLLANNAKIAGRYWPQPLGVLQPGARADVVLIPYHAPTPLDESTVRGHLLYGISQYPVRTTIAGGKVAWHNGRLELDLDEDAVFARSREVATRLWERF